MKIVEIFETVLGWNRLSQSWHNLRNPKEKIDDRYHKLKYDLEKILAACLSVTSVRYSELHCINIKMNWGYREINQQSIQIANKWTKNHPHYKTETTRIYLFLLMRLTKIYINIVKSCCWECRGVGIFVHYWWECQ